ncbi:MAG: leucine-rich repeat domain-containing protein [Proteobacteria bacterium]|nr:leucine-rich repeat domain-containing protein [Pseudomonadota bacterium]
MANDYMLEKGQFGSRLTVQTSWSSDFLDIIREHKVKELELNYAKGWVGKDLSFLEMMPDLEEFEITHWTIDDISPIHKLPALKRLKVSTYCKTEIRFSEFPQLEEVVLEWRPKAKSIFESAGLKRAFINKYPGKDLSKFSLLTNLERLSLASPKLETLNGIEALRGLIFFGVYEARKLKGLNGIETLSKLEILEANGCRGIHEVSQVASLTKLRELHLCDNREIESLKPIAELHNLEKVFFYDETNIRDGDLSPMKNLKNLKVVAYKHRKHYSHSRDEFPRAVPTIDV